MLCIRSPYSDPYFNLAAEEHFLRHSTEEFFMLWKSRAVVVCGKHQNAYAEINYPYLVRNQIPVARRLTGGGTVFHDPGNINFTFIRNGHAGSMIQFTRFIAPVIDFLKSLGIVAVQGPKNDILADGLKISGNAEHVYKNRVLHHGTLLFNANLDMLRESIRRTMGTYRDKSVQSNRSSVMNLSTCLPSSLSNEAFCDQLFSFIRQQHEGLPYTFPPDACHDIQHLADNKYRTWEWIYGWSPDYTYMRTWNSGNLNLQIELDIHRGIITASRCSGTLAPKMEAFNKALPGLPHRETEIRNLLVSMEFQKFTEDFEDLVLAFF